jgi:galactokinase
MRMRSELMYHMHMSLKDINECSLAELDYYHDWLIHEMSNKEEDANG